MVGAGGTEKRKSRSVCGSKREWYQEETHFPKERVAEFWGLGWLWRRREEKGRREWPWWSLRGCEVKRHWGPRRRSPLPTSGSPLWIVNVGSEQQESEVRKKKSLLEKKSITSFFWVGFICLFFWVLISYATSIFEILIFIFINFFFFIKPKFEYWNIWGKLH